MAHIIFAFSVVKCNQIPSTRTVSIHGTLLYVNSHLLVLELACLSSFGEFCDSLGGELSQIHVVFTGL